MNQSSKTRILSILFVLLLISTDLDSKAANKTALYNQRASLKKRINQLLVRRSSLEKDIHNLKLKLKAKQDALSGVYRQLGSANRSIVSINKQLY